MAADEIGMEMIITAKTGNGAVVRHQRPGTLFEVSESSTALRVSPFSLIDFLRFDMDETLSW